MCESEREMERPIEVQRPLVCAARRMTKALPPVISLYLEQPASFHPFIITLFLVPFLLHLTLFLAFTYSPAPIFHYSSLALISVALPSCHFCSFHASFLLPSSCLPSPTPHPQTSTLLCLLIFLPLPTPTISHIMYTQSTSQLLCFFLLPPLFCFPCVSSSMSSPQCVVIIAGLATAETADSQAVGTDREREGQRG